ncbi:hypothetical protein QR680_012312 [Steinernema hermaphroditum]|uniref:PH domain-containing protein n=1 Tax=Steinernema hermaphroditum TaxID=289476 RepID=A0AA39I459_9BILA|nr:hypothetical protein QR680_012312 [Steinernema hermaphroditum]
MVRVFILLTAFLASFSAAQFYPAYDDIGCDLGASYYYTGKPVTLPSMSYHFKSSKEEEALRSWMERIRIIIDGHHYNGGKPMTLPSPAFKSSGDEPNEMEPPSWMKSGRGYRYRRD